MTLHATYIIKRPLITEKGTWEATHPRRKGKAAGEPLNRYTFMVDMRATKPMIKAAVESLYEVRVTNVRTQVRKGIYFRNRYGVGKSTPWKKATVELHPDDRIEMF